VVTNFSINLHSVGVRFIGLYDEVFSGSLPAFRTGRITECRQMTGTSFLRKI